MSDLSAPAPPAGDCCGVEKIFWHRRRRTLFTVAVAIVLLYLAGVTNLWWPTSDSALHLGLGRSLAEGQSYTFNGRTHTLVPPGLPLILGAMQRIFGEGYLAPNLFEALCGLAALAMAYSFLTHWTDRWTALIATVVTAGSYTFYFTSHRILSDAPFALAFWALIYFATRFQTGSLWWLVPMTVTTLVALLIRLPGLLLVDALLIGLLFDRPRAVGLRRRVIGSIAIVATLAVLAGSGLLLARGIVVGKGSYAGIRASSFLETLRSEGIIPWVAGVCHGLCRIPSVLAEMFASQDALWPLGIVLLVLILIGTASLWKTERRLPGLLWIVYLFQLTLVTEARFNDRYLLPVEPILALAAIVGLQWSVKRIYEWQQRVMPLTARSVAVVAFAGILLATNAPRVLRNAFYYSYLGHTGRYYDVVREGKFRRLLTSADILNRQPGTESALVPAEDAKIIHWLTRRLTFALPKTPRQSQEDAREVCDGVSRHPDIRWVILDTGGASPVYRAELLRELLAREPSLELMGEAQGDTVFRRPHPPNPLKGDSDANGADEERRSRHSRHSVPRTPLLCHRPVGLSPHDAPAFATLICEHTLPNRSQSLTDLF